MKSDDPEIEDLLAPKVDEPGLLAPKTSAEITDLPTPKYIPDLLAPKSKSAAEISDLPTPKRDSPGMLEPRADLVAPKGYIDDLPAPAIGGEGLPAPKGYFEDLPQRARTGPGLPAPKGFFDDLPQPAKAHPEPPAPKGHFENLPRPAKPPGASARPVKSPTKPPSTHTVHKGLGDNLPAPAKNRAEVLVPKYEDHKYEAPASTIPLPPARAVTHPPPVTSAASLPERDRPRSFERQDDRPRRAPPRRTEPPKPERPRAPPLLIVAVVLAAAVAAAIYLLRPSANHRADAVESVDAG